METMYYIGLDVHKRTISYCVKDGRGAIRDEGTTPATRFDLDRWMKTLPQPWTATMEATVFTGWIYAQGNSLVMTPPFFAITTSLLLPQPRDAPSEIHAWRIPHPS